MNIPKRVQRLPLRAKYEALAEEAGELDHAAKKVQRILAGDNPTPVKIEDAMREVVEEAGDVWCCLAAIGLDDADALARIAGPKMERWESRLKEKFG